MAPLLLLAAAGCATQKGADASPAWVIQPPRDTAADYYGVGEGPDLEAAKRNALRDIASKIRVVVEGKVSSTTSVRNNQVDRVATHRVSEEIQKTEFKSYTLEKSAKSASGGVHALVRVDRGEYIRSTKDKINKIDAQVNEATAGLDSKPLIEQFVTLKRLRTPLAMALGYYAALSTSDLSDDDNGKISAFEKLAGRSDRIGEQLVFQVQTRPEDQDLNTVVSTFITDNGARTQAGSEASNATLAVTTQVLNDDVQGNKLTRLTVTLLVKDEAQRTVSSQAYVVSGASLTHFDAARRQAVFKLQDEMKKSGLTAALGFKFK